MLFIIDESILFVDKVSDQKNGRNSMELALTERFSLLVWWAVGLGITVYLMLGAVDTIMVLLE